jgi:predicted metal-dependent enzyme (double-stranded beta helix superfamily)
MFDLERFVADCRTCTSASGSPEPVAELVTRAVFTHAAVIEALGVPKRAALNKLYCSHDLTILNVVWAPGMTIMPHNHGMWAVIGIYAGREDNIFWQRLPANPTGRLEAVAAKALGEKEVLTLERDVIHSVVNPISRFSGAIHVYGGDFFGAARSEWDPEFLVEKPMDVARAVALFEEANSRFA